MYDLRLSYLQSPFGRLLTFILCDFLFCFLLSLERQHQCKSPYDARWKRGLQSRCPNILPTREELKEPYYRDLTTYDVNTTNYQAGYNYLTHYKSLPDLWSSWNGDYLHADFPRLIIRMEDTVFYPERVMRMISECSGMPIKEPFQYMTKKGKGESDTNLVTAMVKYGSDRGRVSGDVTARELRYLQTALDPVLMKLLRYRPIRDEDGFAAVVADR